jgi:hypothetical protein
MAPVWPVLLTGLAGNAQNQPNCPNLSISISIWFKSHSYVLHNFVISFMTQDGGNAKDEAVREEENKVNT